MKWIIAAAIIRPQMLWCWPHLYHVILFDIHLNFEWMWVHVLCTPKERTTHHYHPWSLCEPPLSSTDPDKTSHSGNMNHPWIRPLRRCDQRRWQPFNVTPRVTKHLDRCPLAKHWYWELSSRMNNKRMMRLRTRLATRASLWSHPLRPVLIWQCTVVAGPD